MQSERKKGRVHVTFAGVKEEGRTVREATDKCEAVLANVVLRSAPSIVGWRGLFAIAWYERYGWKYEVFSRIKDGTSRVLESSNTFPLTLSRDAMEDHVLRHLVQLAYVVGMKDLPEFNDERVFRECVSWIEFQERYNRARSRGLSDQDAHSAAGRNPLTPSLWRKGDE